MNYPYVFPASQQADISNKKDPDINPGLYFELISVQTF